MYSNSFDVNYGFYDDRAAVMQALCPPGTIINAAQNGCTPCGAGQSDAGFRTECIPCADPSWCLGGNITSNTNCIASRKGPGCSQCASGYAQFQGDCTKCPDNSGALVLPVIVLLLVLRAGRERRQLHARHARHGVPLRRKQR